MGADLEGFRNSSKVKHRYGLVADHPSIMPRGNGRDVALFQVELTPVRHHDVEVSSKEADEVRGFAVLTATDYRLLMLRPFPTRLERRATDTAVSDVDDIDPAMLHVQYLIGRVERSDLLIWHTAPSMAFDEFASRDQRPTSSSFPISYESVQFSSTGCVLGLDDRAEIC